MTDRSPHLVVAVLDSDPDTTEMLKTWLEFNDFVVATGNLTEFRLGHASLIEFLERTNPDIVLYDLGPPYETNVEYLRRIRSDPAFPKCEVVITTTNAQLVERLFGIHAIEIVGKPYDLSALVDALRATTLPSRDPPADNRDCQHDDRRHGDRRFGERRNNGFLH